MLIQKNVFKITQLGHYNISYRKLFIAWIYHKPYHIKTARESIEYPNNSNL